ncbi:MAG: leucine-rich repeat domain-containing protein [Oscillospiraceae bacterium]
MSRRTKNRNIIIIGLSSIVLLMAIGYAAFQTVLKIEGTSNISSTWDVQITGITKDKTKGNVTEISEPTFDKESANFKVGLESPGDYIYYKVAVTNKGSLAAIAKLGNLTCSNSNALQCGAYADSNVGNIETNTDLTERRLIIGPNETEYYNVWIKYNDDITVQPNVTNIDIKLTLTYEQSDVGITHTTEDKCYTGKVLENGTLTITDYDEKCGTDVVIPETIDGYTVTEIQDGKWDSNIGKTVSPFANKGITSVVISNNIKNIGVAAFRSNRIANLVLGDNVQTIEGEAFASNRLTTVNFPSSLKTIGSMSFYGNRLTSLDIPSSITALGGGAFTYNNLSGDEKYIYGKNNDGSTDYTFLTSYASTDATKAELPSTIRTIGYAAFRTVTGSYLELPETVKTVNQSAFWQSAITNIKLNEGLLIIGDNSFAGMPIESINIPNSVTSIGKSAFTNCKLKTVTIGSGIKTIGINAFQYTELANGTIYNPITSITINKKEGSITGSPWGATKAQINWTGTN